MGLAEGKSYSYLRLDPALPNYLKLKLQDEEQQHYRLRWSEAISQLVDFLYDQQFQKADLAAQLTQLELPNLMAFIHKLNEQLQTDQVDAETVTAKAGRIEKLLTNLNYPQALAEVVSIRHQAIEQLGEWNHVRFESEQLTIERLFALGDIPAAFEAAQKLLQQSEQAGTEAYSGAAYDLAYIYWFFGRVLRTGGFATKALPYLKQAFQHFEALEEQGAAHMASVSLTDLGHCLINLGKLEQASEVCRDAIQRAEKLDDTRQVAVGRLHLATVYYLQNGYTAALQAYHGVLEFFQQLNDPITVAGIHYQIGMVYREQAQLEQAESAYRQSLSIATRQGERTLEAASLGGLASLYNIWNHPEQAVDYYRQAADIYIQLGDLHYQGVTHFNIASTLIKLNRRNEARPELLRAIECDKSLGHAAEPWKNWNILYDLELADGNPQAAQQARQKAIHAFLSYRQDGGENHDGAGRLALRVLQSIQQEDTAEVKQDIEQHLEQVDSQGDKTFLHNLLALLTGDRNPALAEDDEMNYQQVVELKILLEQLQ